MAAAKTLPMSIPSNGSVPETPMTSDEQSWETNVYDSDYVQNSKRGPLSNLTSMGSSSPSTTTTTGTANNGTTTATDTFTVAGTKELIQSGAMTPRQVAILTRETRTLIGRVVSFCFENCETDAVQMNPSELIKFIDNLMSSFMDEDEKAPSSSDLVEKYLNSNGFIEFEKFCQETEFELFIKNACQKKIIRQDKNAVMPQDHFRSQSTRRDIDLLARQMHAMSPLHRANPRLSHLFNSTFASSHDLMRRPSTQMVPHEETEEYVAIIERQQMEIERLTGFSDQLQSKIDAQTRELDVLKEHLEVIKDERDLVNEEKNQLIEQNEQLSQQVDHLRLQNLESASLARDSFNILNKYHEEKDLDEDEMDRLAKHRHDMLRKTNVLHISANPSLDSHDELSAINEANTDDDDFKSSDTHFRRTSRGKTMELQMDLLKVAQNEIKLKDDEMDQIMSQINDLKKDLNEKETKMNQYMQSYHEKLNENEGLIVKIREQSEKIVECERIIEEMKEIHETELLKPRSGKHLSIHLASQKTRQIFLPPEETEAGPPSTFRMKTSKSTKNLHNPTDTLDIPGHMRMDTRGYQMNRNKSIRLSTSSMNGGQGHVASLESMMNGGGFNFPVSGFPASVNVSRSHTPQASMGPLDINSMSFEEDDHALELLDKERAAHEEERIVWKNQLEQANTQWRLKMDEKESSWTEKYEKSIQEWQDKYDAKQKEIDDHVCPLEKTEESGQAPETEILLRAKINQYENELKEKETEMNEKLNEREIEWKKELENQMNESKSGIMTANKEWNDKLNEQKDDFEYRESVYLKEIDDLKKKCEMMSLENNAMQVELIMTDQKLNEEDDDEDNDGGAESSLSDSNEILEHHDSQKNVLSNIDDAKEDEFLEIHSDGEEEEPTNETFIENPDEEDEPEPVPNSMSHENDEEEEDDDDGLVIFDESMVPQKVAVKFDLDPRNGGPNHPLTSYDDSNDHKRRKKQSTRDAPKRSQSERSVRIRYKEDSVDYRPRETKRDKRDKRKRSPSRSHSRSKRKHRSKRKKKDRYEDDEDDRHYHRSSKRRNKKDRHRHREHSRSKRRDRYSHKDKKKSSRSKKKKKRYDQTSDDMSMLESHEGMELYRLYSGTSSTEEMSEYSRRKGPRYVRKTDKDANKLYACTSGCDMPKQIPRCNGTGWFHFLHL